MKVAALDLGSNTTLLLIAEVEQGKVTQVYRDELRVTRLGQGVHANREFHQEALARVESAFQEFQKIIAEEQPAKTLAMATSAARDVKNGQALFELGEKYGIPIKIIPGDQEAHLTFSGACSDFDDKTKFAVIDVGGGSTEIVFQKANGELTGHSLDVGSVRLTELFVTEHPVPELQISEIASYVKNKISEKSWDENAKCIENLVCVAGTPTTLAAVLQEVDFSKDAVDGFKISLQQMVQIRDRLARMNLDQRKALKGMDPKRADVIVTGATILIETAKIFGVDELIVSDRGVRFGVALAMESLENNV